MAKEKMKVAPDHTMCYSTEVVDKQDVLAIIDNYTSYILRQEHNRNRIREADVIEGLRERVERMPIRESIPVEYIYRKIGRIMKIKGKEATQYASHIASIVVSWEKEHVSKE